MLGDWKWMGVLAVVTMLACGCEVKVDDSTHTTTQVEGVDDGSVGVGDNPGNDNSPETKTENASGDGSQA